MTVVASLPTSPALRDRIRTIYIDATLIGALLSIVLIAGIPLWILAHTVDRRRRTARRLTRALYGPLLRHYGRRFGKPPVVENPAGIDWPALGPSIIVANHASAMDIVALMQLPPGIGDGRVWAKAWPFRTPLLGTLMRFCGHLHVDDFNILPDAQQCLAEGESLLVFPESSRSRTGRLNRFRDGAFLLAARTGIPVVPIAIHGTHACFPPGQPWIYPPVIRLEVLGMLRPTPGDPRAHAHLKRQAFAMIGAALAGTSASATIEPVAA
jgi:1-acyl-sn-glycerol-3-phosphate acyltransferase